MAEESSSTTSLRSLAGEAPRGSQHVRAMCHAVALELDSTRFIVCPRAQVVDGAMGAQWLQAFKKRIESPLEMLV